MHYFRNCFGSEAPSGTLFLLNAEAPARYNEGQGRHGQAGNDEEGGHAEDKEEGHASEEEAEGDGEYNENSKAHKEGYVSSSVLRATTWRQ